MIRITVSTPSGDYWMLMTPKSAHTQGYIDCEEYLRLTRNGEEHAEVDNDRVGPRS